MRGGVVSICRSEVQPLGSGIVSLFVLECIGNWGVCSFLLSVPVVSTFADFCGWGVVEFSVRDEFSGNGVSVIGGNRHAPVEWAPWRPPAVPACGLCEEFRVAGASIL